MVEDFYEKDSVEAGNAYFMVGVYYFEHQQLQKSLACFIKTLYIRKVKLGQTSLGCADCYYNMAILYKKLGIFVKSIENYQNALKIRKEKIGPHSLQVSNILEQIGKFYIE